MRTGIRLGGAVMVAALVLAGCSGDDGASVRELDGSGSATGSGSASGSVSSSGSVSGSGSGSASGVSDDGGASGALGAYTPVSDVAPHAAVSLDVCAVNDLLDAETIDFDDVRAVYEHGGSSVNGDGSVRTLAGFATSERDEAIWNTYVDHFGAPTWLDTFVSEALDGAGPFADEADAVRRQGVQKGIQNQVMVAWTIHELVAALEKAEAGELEPASGAPHNWDEGWAFYHGSEPGCGAPFATADKRGADFGTDSAVNDAILVAFEDGLQALLDGDVDATQAAADEIVRQITITYVQATLKYATAAAQAVADGDDDRARVQQAEGWAFFRVIEPLVAEVDADAAAAISEVLALPNPPAADGAGTVADALGSVYEGLGITDAEVGEFTG